MRASEEQFTTMCLRRKHLRRFVNMERRTGLRRAVLIERLLRFGERNIEALVQPDAAHAVTTTARGIPA